MTAPESEPKIKWQVKAAGVAAAALIGGFLSRWHGGGFISGSPKALKAGLWSLPFALATGAAWFLHPPMIFWGMIWLTASIIALVVLGLCMVFKNTGHGGGMDLAHNPKEPGGTPSRSPEKLEYLILWLHGKMPQYWYDALLLAIIGFFSTLAPAIAIGMVNIWAGLVIGAGGLLGKPAAYMIGWVLEDEGIVQKLPDDLDEGTAVGEALTGVFAYSALAIGALMAVFS